MAHQGLKWIVNSSRRNIWTFRTKSLECKTLVLTQKECRGLPLYLRNSLFPWQVKCEGGGETKEKSPQPLLQTSFFQQQHLPHPNQLYTTTIIVCYSSATSVCKEAPYCPFSTALWKQKSSSSVTLLAMQLQDNLNRHGTQKYKLVLPLFLWHTGWPDIQGSRAQLKTPDPRMCRDDAARHSLDKKAAMVTQSNWGARTTTF